MTNFKGTREAFAAAMMDMAEEREDIVVISPDSLKAMRAVPFGEKYPNRYLECGIAEQGVDLPPVPRRGKKFGAAEDLVVQPGKAGGIGGKQLERGGNAHAGVGRAIDRVRTKADHRAAHQVLPPVARLKPSKNLLHPS